MAKTLDEAGVKRLIQEIKGANKNLNAPIIISTENTTESMAQNVKNIADYVEKAKAAGIANVDGMAVNCLIDGGAYSGVGYLYVYIANEITIQGVIIKDDLVDNMCFKIYTDGSYNEKALIVADNNKAVVTSNMLDEGARKPIILTPSTTEVDEETYQKLLSDDVDVVFKTEEGKICTFVDSSVYGGAHHLFFTNLITANNAMDTQIYGVELSIKVTAPHMVLVDILYDDLFSEFLDQSGYLNKSTLTPVLQEIDLTGTDADRKAKLDQFETDWKALTGASDLTGARFVGFVDVESGLEVIFSYNASNGYWSGLNKFADGVTSVTISPLDGSLTITPLFSHLEAITIKTGNTPDDKAANVAAIKAYVDNLKLLGVDTTKGYMMPCKFPNSVAGVLSAVSNSLIVAITTNGRGELNCYEVYIGGDNPGAVYSIGGFQLKISSALTTTSKKIVGAINEVNALVKGYSTPIELTTETAQNKTAIDARVAAFTAQGISLTNGCCIPVTYKGVYAGNISLINGDWYGLLVKNTNNPADNINIKLSADGTVTEGNSAQ